MNLQISVSMVSFIQGIITLLMESVLIYSILFQPKDQIDSFSFVFPYLIVYVLVGLSLLNMYLLKKNVIVPAEFVTQRLNEFLEWGIMLLLLIFFVINSFGDWISLIVFLLFLLILNSSSSFSDPQYRFFFLILEIIVLVFGFGLLAIIAFRELPVYQLLVSIWIEVGDNFVPSIHNIEKPPHDFPFSVFPLLFLVVVIFVPFLSIRLFLTMGKLKQGNLPEKDSLGWGLSYYIKSMVFVTMILYLVIGMG